MKHALKTIAALLGLLAFSLSPLLAFLASAALMG